MMTARENKMLQAPLENKAGMEPPKYRIPTGRVDAVVFARVLEDTGPVPVLDLRTWRRSPADVSEDAFQPTSQPPVIELQYVPGMLEAIARAAGLEVSVRERAEAA